MKPHSNLLHQSTTSIQFQRERGLLFLAWPLEKPTHRAKFLPAATTQEIRTFDIFCGQFILQNDRLYVLYICFAQQILALITAPWWVYVGVNAMLACCLFLSMGFVSHRVKIAIITVTPRRKFMLEPQRESSKSMETVPRRGGGDGGRVPQAPSESGPLPNKPRSDRKKTSVSGIDDTAYTQKRGIEYPATTRDVKEKRIVEFAPPSALERTPIAFEGYARVFFQRKTDAYERQLLPANSSGSTSFDSHVYVTIGAITGTLNFYPYKHQHNGNSQKGVPLIVDPPIELKYFVAELLPQSLCGVGLYVADDDVEMRRPVFRLEFRNDSTLQSYERVNNFTLASKKMTQLSSKYGAVKNVTSATKNVFASHDDVEAARRLEKQKLQDACSQYLDEIGGMCRDATHIARRFVRIANERTIIVPQPVPLKTAVEKKKKAVVDDEDEASSDMSDLYSGSSG